MKIPSVLVLVSLLAVSPVSVAFAAEPAAGAPAEAAAQLQVGPINFANVRWAGDTWFEAEVEVTAKPGGRAVSGQYIDRVKVTLNLGLETTDEKGAKRIVLYRSSAEAVSLEGGARTFFRFYLPPEIVKRDKLRTDAKYYAVELEAGGQAVPTLPGSFSKDFSSADSLKNFLSKVSSEGAQNEGILVPQHLSPFAYDSQRHAPSVIRRDGQR